MGLEDQWEVAQYTAPLKLTPEAFCAQFGYLVSGEGKLLGVAHFVSLQLNRLIAK